MLGESRRGYLAASLKKTAKNGLMSFLRTKKPGNTEVGEPKATETKAE